MKKILPYITIILSVFFWGLSYIASEICLRYVSPLMLVTFRTVIAGVLLFIIWKAFEGGVKLKKQHLLRFFISGVLCINCYMIFEIVGLKYTSPAIVAIILASIPIISLVVDKFILKTKMGIFKILGVVMSLIGVGMVIGADLSSISGGSRAIGYVLVFCAALSWVAFNYATKPLYKDYSPLTITTVQMIAGASVFAVISLFLKEPLPKVDFAFTFNLLYLAIICSATCILLYIYSMKKLGVVTTALYINIQPLVTVGASAVILKEFLGGVQMIGGLLIIMAVYISSITAKPKIETEDEIIEKNVVLCEEDLA